jgi:hypothetical protein
MTISLRSLLYRLVLGLLLGLLATATVLTPSLTDSAAASPAPTAQTIAVVQANESSNWSGYNQGILETGKSGGFHQVSAQWVVPTATQHQNGAAEYSSTWVGIGGGCLDLACTATDNTLIQAGTEQDVAANGAASYSAWWEVIPGPSLTISGLAVKAGDTVSVDIHELVANSNAWSITVKVNGATFSQTVPYSSTHGTAEWIVETPLILGANAGFSAMPDLSKPQFTSAKANNANAGLIVGEQMDLVSGSQRIATPSAPTNGNSFSVCTYASSC